MYWESLLHSARKRIVQTLLIGAGDYGLSFVFQAQRTPGLRVCAIHDRSIERGLAAFRHAGLPGEAIAICESLGAAQAVLQAGRVFVTPDPLLPMQLPIDLVVEATGSPEAAACHAEAALQHGKHVAMVTKEADIVIGPLLSRRARGAGLIYTPVDGDQPSLLMQLVFWARVLGLEVLCAGKASEYDFVYDRAARRVTSFNRTIDAQDLEPLWDFGGQEARTIVEARAKVLAALPQHTVPDLVEMGLVANASGLGVDTAALHAPILRTTEIADVLVPRDLGGILDSGGVVDVVNVLRRPDETSLAGGVFVVVRCKDRRTWEVLRAKGHLVNPKGEAAMIYRPLHLLGVESATTVLSAVLQGRSSGPEDVQPRFDVVGITSKALSVGTRLAATGHHHQIDGVEGLLVPARRAAGPNPVPFYLMANNCLRRDVPAGTILSAEMIEPPMESKLWTLREELEETFALQ